MEGETSNDVSPLRSRKSVVRNIHLSSTKLIARMYCRNCLYRLKMKRAKNGCSSRLGEVKSLSRI